MRIISFAWTTPALLVLLKTCTRRDWTDAWALRFKKGDLVQAWDKSPRFKGKKVATIELTADPYRETTETPLADYENEGFHYMVAIGAKVGKWTPADIWNNWNMRPSNLYVVRFKVVELFDYSELGSDRWKKYQLQTGGNKPLILYPEEQTYGAASSKP